MLGHDFSIAFFFLINCINCLEQWLINPHDSGLGGDDCKPRALARGGVITVNQSASSGIASKSRSFSNCNEKSPRLRKRYSMIFFESLNI